MYYNIYERAAIKEVREQVREHFDMFSSTSDESSTVRNFPGSFIVPPDNSLRVIV